MTDSNDNQSEEWYEKDLNRFRRWLQEKYPEIYEKYYDNFSYPLTINGGFSVNSNNRISDEERKIIDNIADEFYRTQDL